MNAYVARGFACEHGGLYEDRLTGKPREFDIRATYWGGQWNLRLAVEAKNIGSNFPLLVECLRRRREETFHDVIVGFSNTEIAKPQSISTLGGMPRPQRVQPKAETSRVEMGSHCLYQLSQPVGKSCEQVGREDNRTSGIKTLGKEMYEKWAQAISSAYELSRIYHTERQPEQREYSLVLPVVVVPNGTLWQVVYDHEGKRLNVPVQVDRCPYFVGQKFRHTFEGWQYDITLSHIEFVTLRGLEKLINDIISGAIPVVGSGAQAVIEGRVNGGGIPF